MAPPDTRKDHPDPSEARHQKATEFDGGAAPKGVPRDAFKPKDDTPLILKKKEGAKRTEAESDPLPELGLKRPTER